jgi:hypothetical protein
MNSTMSEESFVCAQCGQRHAGLPTDWGCRKPDEIHALSYLEEYRRVRMNADLATLDGKRYFIRCALPLPMVGRSDFFVWDTWVEVSRKHHHLYVEHFDADATGLPGFAGYLANQLPGYRDTLELEVEVELPPAGKRPSLWLPVDSPHALAREQAKGIDAVRHHEILEACGHFKRKES